MGDVIEKAGGWATAQKASGGDKFQRVWSRLSAADRLVLLGHTRDELGPGDRALLAKAARAVYVKKLRRG